MEELITFVSEHVVGISGSLLVAALGAHLVWRNNRVSRVAIASTEFRAAFNDALLRLTASREATSIIIYQNHNGHLAAIFAFQPYVPRYRRRSFERAAKEYSLQANIQNAKGPLEALIFDFTPEAQAQRAALLASIQKLLHHALST